MSLLTEAILVSISGRPLLLPKMASFLGSILASSLEPKSIFFGVCGR